MTDKVILKAVVVEMPKKITESIHSIPGGFVDNRWLHERVLNINQHKIEYRAPRGHIYNGRTKIVPGVFCFDVEVELGVKIDQVVSDNYVFHGVLPLEERPDGTLCHVDWFE